MNRPIKPIRRNTVSAEIYNLLKENPNLGMKEICERLDKGMGSVSGTLTRLIQREWVIKSESHPATYSISPIDPKVKVAKIYQLTKNKLKGNAKVDELINLLEGELQIVEEQIQYLEECREKLQISISIAKQRIGQQNIS